MELITKDDPLAQSADVISGNLDNLRQLFPEAFAEGQVDFDTLRQLLGDAVDDGHEKYGLSWHGKRKARQLALTPSTGTLRPAPEESVAWDTTQNLMIEGDNLEVLKLLQKSYAGRVKLIYIDPPYNTGKDFVYADDFKQPVRRYKEVTGQIEGGKAVTSNVESSGRFHTDWLNMIYPRLMLARELLAQDGALVVSIDDGEVDNLRKSLNEVFGEENFVSTIIWQKKYAPANDAKWLSDNHDYLVLVAFDKETWRPNLLPRTAAANARYSNPDDDPRGEWKSSGLDVKTYTEANDYEITTPSGRVVRPPAGACWRVSPKRFEEMVTDDRIWFGKDGSNVPAIKRFLTEVKQGITPLTIWTYKEVGHSQEATQEVRALGVTGFDSPKPVRLLERVVEIVGPKDGIVLDFFAGSGTTAHAVMARNATDGGTRRYVLVQLPEPIEPTDQRQKIAASFCDKMGKPRSVAELTKERLRRAAKVIQEEHPDYEGDLGFRVYKLDESNIRAWAPEPDDLEGTLLDHVEHIQEGRTEQDILVELLLKLGLDLCVPIETREIGGKAVHSVGAGTLFVALPDRVSCDEAETLAEGIAKWRAELDPAGDSTVVLRDGAFDDDVAKTNLAAILNQHGIQTVRSI